MVTRREMAASLAAVVAGTSLPLGWMGRAMAASRSETVDAVSAPGGSGEVDVLVVGAGVAGIAAARELRARGLSVLVLEARDRIGGRTFTDTATLGVPVDVGGQWLHHSNHNAFVGVAKQLGVPLTLSDREAGWLFRDGARLPKADVKAYLDAEQELLKRAAAVLRSGRDISLAMMAKGDATLEQVAAQVAAADSAQDANLLSVQDLAAISLLEGGDFDVGGGLGALVARWGADEPVALNKAVAQIDWSGTGVEATGSFGKVKARGAIVTVPTSLLAAGRIRFAPDLPVVTQESFAQLPLGLMLKVSFKLTHQFPQLPPYGVDMAAVSAGVHHAVHISPALPLMTVMFGGSEAWELEREGARAAASAAREVIVGIAGSGVKDTIVGTRVSGWGSDPWSLGSYSAAQVGYAKAREVYAQPVGDRLWFAGEACVGPEAATVGGAYSAGLAAARQIAAKLTSAKGTAL